MNHGSLFSGIGGFDLAAQWCGWNNVFQVENDKFCNKVLEKNFPNTKRYGDIKKFNGREYEGKIDIISGGFPCQPFSVAGKRKSSEDNRFLWHEMFRVISEVKPAWVVAENVRGIVSIEGGMVFEQVQADLESIGYEVQPFLIPACSKNAPHRRDRIWIVAYSDIRGRGGKARTGNSNLRRIESQKQDNNSNSSNSGCRDAQDTGCEHGERQTDKRESDNEIGQGNAIEFERPIGCNGIRLNSNSGGTGLRRLDIGGLQPEIIGSGENAPDTTGGRFEQCLSFGQKKNDISKKNIPNAPNTEREGLGRHNSEREIQRGRNGCSAECNRIPEWTENWIEVATCLCRVADGVSNRVDRLKALGNAIVPQVAYEIFKAISLIDN